MTRYDEKGFPILITQQVGATAAPKSYDQQGFLITAEPTPVATAIAQTADSVQRRTSTNGANPHRIVAKGLGAAAACGLVGGALIL